MKKLHSKPDVSSERTKLGVKKSWAVTPGFLDGVCQHKAVTSENVANEDRTLRYKLREKSAGVSPSLSLISAQAKASAVGTSQAINLTLRNHGASRATQREKNPLYSHSG